MKERPILFSGPMVRAILEGRKTQTRRVVKFLSVNSHPWRFLEMSLGCALFERANRIISGYEVVTEGNQIKCPYGQVGDRLWVRETFVEYPPLFPTDRHGEIHYHADDAHDCVRPWGGLNWRPAIFMPRWASRITLEITDVRVQGLQEISNTDAICEGIACTDFSEHRPADAFHLLWDSINCKTYSWSANPWVWALTFKVVKP